jgi:hypothetical protein
MLNVEPSVKTKFQGKLDEFMWKRGSFDRRFRIYKEVLGDQAALEAAARNARIVADYLTGKFTMREIGMREGISHERVRQVLSDQAPGYKDVRKARRKAVTAELLLSKDARREAAFFQLWGCNRKRFAEILAAFPDARLRFKENKGNAHTMKRPWKMTFCEWATCWIESGKLQLRGHKGMRGSGRSKQFWMSPINPSIGYTVGNVRIVQVVEVLEERDRRKAG